MLVEAVFALRFCRLIHSAVPRVKRIVYSTCSVHAIENERVVCEALKSDEAKRRPFKLASSGEVLPNWHRRGLSDEFESPGKNDHFAASPLSDTLVQSMHRRLSAVHLMKMQQTASSFRVLSAVAVEPKRNVPKIIPRQGSGKEMKTTLRNEKLGRNENDI